MNEDVSAFGPEAAALLKTFQPHLVHDTENAIAAFYRGLFRQTHGTDVVRRLTSAQFADTQRPLLAHLRALSSPGLDAGIRRQGAVEIGRTHAFVGIQTSWLIEGYQQYLRRLMQQVQECPGTSEQRRSLRHILTTRLMADMNGQLQGHHGVLRAEQDAIVQMSRLHPTTTLFGGFIKQLLDILTHLDGMVAGTLSRPDAQGDIHYEIVVGESLEHHVGCLIENRLIPTIRDDDPRGQGPSGRAWRTGETQQAFVIASDAPLSPWCRFAHERGYCSQVTVPVADAGGSPYALLTLYHGSPGYFAVPERAGFLEHLRVILGTALNRSHKAGAVLTHAIRTSYREQLAKGSITILYQPVIDLKSGQLHKVEALARLHHVGGCHVSPGHFLAAFGERELRQLFAHGLRQALNDLLAWEAQGLTTSVAVNLPPQGLMEPEYLQIARDILRETGADPARLTLELLETAEIDHTQNLRSALSEWRTLGVHLAQDDLGSGYSSLIRLEQLAIDDVKIDHGLVGTAVHAPRKALQFIHHLTHLAHDIGARVTVEGLENPSLVEAASILGGDFGQGYAIARPMAAPALLSWSHKPPALIIDPDDPKTALGAFAALIIRNALMDLAADRPGLLGSVIAQPCALSRYLRANQLEGGPIGAAHVALQAAAAGGARAPSYIEARLTLENLLSAHIQAEATTARPPMVPYSGHGGGDQRAVC